MLGISCSSFFYTYVFCYFVCISGINHLKSIINGAFLFFYAAIETLSRLVLFVGLKYFNIGFVLFFILRLGQ